MTAAVLTKARHFDFVHSVIPEAPCIERLGDLRGADMLFSFGSGVIVPPDILNNLKVAVNFHAAPPTYPGRDPHHWAAYDQATEYGATAHWMTERVDAGPIIGAFIIAMKPGGPEDYRKAGERTARALFEEIVPKFIAGDILGWQGTKRSRRDLIAMCDLRNLPTYEAARRRFAFAGFEQHFVTA